MYFKLSFFFLQITYLIPNCEFYTKKTIVKHENSDVQNKKKNGEYI